MSSIGYVLRRKATFDKKTQTLVVDTHSRFGAGRLHPAILADTLLTVLSGDATDPASTFNSHEPKTMEFVPCQGLGGYDYLDISDCSNDGDISVKYIEFTHGYTRNQCVDSCEGLMLAGVLSRYEMGSKADTEEEETCTCRDEPTSTIGDEPISEYGADCSDTLGDTESEETSGEQEEEQLGEPNSPLLGGSVCTA